MKSDPVTTDEGVWEGEVSGSGVTEERNDPVRAHTYPWSIIIDCHSL